MTSSGSTSVKQRQEFLSFGWMDMDMDSYE